MLNISEICSCCGIDVIREKVLVQQFSDNTKNFCEQCVNKGLDGWYKRKYEDRIIRKPNRKTKFLT